MQKRDPAPAFDPVTPDAPIRADSHGGRAKCLQRLIRLGLPVPETVALPFRTVRLIAAGHPADAQGILSVFGDAPVVSVRPSSEDPDWGGPGAVLNVGLCRARRDAFATTFGEETADALYLRFIRAYAEQVAHIEPEAVARWETVEEALRAYEEETDEPFPEDPARQLSDVLRSMARAWEGTSARLLRQARGAPANAGLGLVVQRMALGVGPGISGSGVIQFIEGKTGRRQITGRWREQSQGREALGASGSLYLTRDARGPSLEERAPDTFAELVRMGEVCRSRLREEMQIEFTLDDGRLSILDAVRVQRSGQAAVRVAVTLAEDGVISPEEAVLRVPPRELSELLHRQADPEAAREVIARGIAASPGAAVGRLVF